MKKPKAPRLVIVAIFTTITIVFWVFYSLYSVLVKTKNVELDPKLLAPITPSLDKTSLDKLEGRIFFEESQTEEIFSNPPSNPTPAELPSIIPTIVKESKPQSTKAGELMQ